MRLPHPQLASLGFLADSSEEVIDLLGRDVTPTEASLIKHYFSSQLPPITSRSALAVMFGYSEGFLWSLLTRTSRYYRSFDIPKGDEKRRIYAPKVSLKLIQKWLSIHFQEKWPANSSVHGFVPGRSHLSAAARHLGKEWVVSIDIENFFPSVSLQRVGLALDKLGYADDFSKQAITKLTCLGGGLTQGSPTSPVLSNIALDGVDQKLQELAEGNSWTFTRYADDIVFSGTGGSPDSAIKGIRDILSLDGWKIAEKKTRADRLPGRLKVHGLLVHGNNIRLTKGYRNKIRAYQHLLNSGRIKDSDMYKVLGHINFAKSVDDFNSRTDDDLG